MTMGVALAFALLQNLTPKTEAGQTAVVEIMSVVEVDVKAKDIESAKPDESSRTVLREQYTQLVKEAKEGRATRLKLSCDRSTIEQSGTKIPMTGQVATERELATFEVTLGEAPKREDGKPVPDGSGHIGRWEDFTELLKGASAATWKVDAKKLSLLSIGGKESALNGQLSCAKEGVADGIATISFAGAKLGGVVGEGETLIADVKGKLLFDTNTGRPTQISIEGSFAYDKKITHVEPGSENTKRQVDVGTISVRSKEWSVDVKFKNP